MITAESNGMPYGIANSMSRADRDDTVTEAPCKALRRSSAKPSRKASRKSCPGCGMVVISTTGFCWNCDNAKMESNPMASHIESVSKRSRTLAKYPEVSTTKVLSYRFSEADPIFANLAKYIGEPRDTKETAQLRRVSALVAAGLVSEDSVYDAANGVRQCRPEKPFAYFMTSLRESVVKKQGKDLATLWRLPIQLISS